MLVYRVETKDNRGPYTWYDTDRFSISGTLYEYRRPAVQLTRPVPTDDNLCIDDFRSVYKKHPRYKKSNVDGNTLFGFKDLVSLNNWFTEKTRKKMEAELKKHKKAGTFQVSVYNIPKAHVKMGNKQLVFFKPKAKKVNALSLVTLEEIKEETDVPKVKKTIKTKKPDSKRHVDIPFI